MDKKISGIILPGSEDTYRFIPDTVAGFSENDTSTKTNEAADAGAVKNALEKTNNDLSQLNQTINIDIKNLEKTNINLSQLTETVTNNNENLTTSIANTNAQLSGINNNLLQIQKNNDYYKIVDLLTNGLKDGSKTFPSENQIRMSNQNYILIKQFSEDFSSLRTQLIEKQQDQTKILGVLEKTFYPNGTIKTSISIKE